VKPVRFTVTNKVVGCCCSKKQIIWIFHAHVETVIARLGHGYAYQRNMSGMMSDVMLVMTTEFDVDLYTARE